MNFLRRTGSIVACLLLTCFINTGCNQQNSNSAQNSPTTNSPKDSAKVEQKNDAEKPVEIETNKEGVKNAGIPPTDSSPTNSANPQNPTGSKTADIPTNMPENLVANAPKLAEWKPKSEQLVQAEGNPPRVALTFDAGSDAKAVEKILQILKEKEVHATFFLTGKFCEQFPKESKAIADAGMELGNHSYSHPPFTKLSDEKIKEQLEKTEAAIIKACGRGAKPLFRFPYGDSNKRVCEMVAKCGYQPIYWTLDSWDSVKKNITADFIVQRINGKVKKGYITLMHVSSEPSADALPKIFEHLEKIGAKVVPVSEILLESVDSKPSLRVTLR